jgi:uncharacterized protein
MEHLIRNSQWLISQVGDDMVREVPRKINWEWRLNGITGARGCGKTTRMLQQARIWQKAEAKVLYITLDDFYFSTHRPFDVASAFSKMGGQYLFIDEVHKYEGWSTELKNIYDLLPELIVTFSGSSVIQIAKQNADLSRRALMYEMPGLSFREFLRWAHDIQIPAITLPELLNRHEKWALEVVQQVRPLAYWHEYLTKGYYPFFAEKNRDYLLSVLQLLKYVIEVDFQYIEGYQAGYSKKIQAILRIISQAPPFTPNISKLAEQVGINRNTMVNYLHYMDQALLIRNLYYPGQSISHLQKPDKVLLSNPNLYHVLVEEQADKGSLRESAFVSMLRPTETLHLHPQADYSCGDYTFEIGGRRKGKQQIAGIEDAYIVKDDIELGVGNSIPLWAFGFLY